MLTEQQLIEASKILASRAGKRAWAAMSKKQRSERATKASRAAAIARRANAAARKEQGK